MPSILTLEGARKHKTLGAADEVGSCRCVYNPRTKQHRKLCWFGKKPGKRGSGWKFVKGSCRP